MKPELKQIEEKVQEIYKFMINVYPELEGIERINVEERHEEYKEILGGFCYDGTLAILKFPIDKSLLKSIKDANKYIDIFIDGDSPIKMEMFDYISLFNIEDTITARCILTLLHELGHFHRLCKIEKVLNVKMDLVNMGDGEDITFVIDQYYNEKEYEKYTVEELTFKNDLLAAELYADKFAYMNFPRIIHLLK